MRDWLALVAFGAIALFVVTAGCSPSRPDLARLPADQQQYLIRLARVTQVELPPLDWYSLPPLPRARQVVLPIEVQQIDWVELLTLNQCELGPLIGYRNSVLGRVQSASERWLYERELLQRLQACGPEAEDRELFEGLTSTKAQQLPQLRYNAILAGPEWRAMMSLQKLSSGSALVNSRDVDLEQALYRLLGLATQQDVPPHSEFYEPLQALHFSNAGGGLRRQWRAHTLVLSTAATVLERAKAAPLCRNGQPTPRARNLQGVFLRYYVQQLQPQLSAMPAPDRGWLRAQDRLVRELIDEPDGPTSRLFEWYSAVFTDAPGSEFSRWRAAVDRHSRAWGWHLEACGLLPQPAADLADGLRD